MSQKHYYTDEKNAQEGIAVRMESNGSGSAQTGGKWYNMRRMKRAESDMAQCESRLVGLRNCRHFLPRGLML